LEYASRRSKSSKANLLVCQDHDLTHPQIQAACIVSLDAWKLFGCRDAGRVDIRFDSNESDAVPNILEVSIMTPFLFVFILFALGSYLRCAGEPDFRLASGPFATAG
jgi:hypothetical protein